MIYKIGLGLCLILAVPIFAQESKIIKGKVVTSPKKGEVSGVPGVKLKWVKDANLGLSDVDGNFKINVNQLPDTLIISYTGYNTIYYEIKDTNEVYTFNLKEGLVLDGVEVVAKNVGKHIDLMDPRHVETIGTGELRKAACCNLSESFETNASVDVNMTDAVSGAKKIQMLGLDGVYTQLQWENIPLVRGLSTSYGLNFTPGTWIESIQITKGTGSVLNGYESMAGMINLELKKPNESELLYVNMYGNKFGRMELNLHGAQVLNPKWSTMTFAHVAHQSFESDVNKDGFRDMPIGTLGAFMHRWNFEGENSEAKFGIKATYADKEGGQIGSSNFDVSNPKWNASFNTEHIELFAKNGYFLKNRPAGSLGLIAQAKYHHMNNQFGNSEYDGTQKKIYLNTIYGDIIGNTNHNIKTGASFILDDYTQRYNDSVFLKTEIVPGAYLEYTYNRLDKFILVAGFRGDYHNLYGPLITPRMHAKWNINQRNAIRISVGRGYRVPNPFADYNGYMASNRQWIVNPNIVPEDGVSAGITYTQKFIMFDNAASFTTDYFYTHFFNQLLVDLDVAPNEIHVYNTNETSFAHSFQAELSVEPLKGFELRSAFKYYDVRASFNGELQQKAFVPKYRVLLNAGYETRNKKWSFDLTGNWVGQKRLPSLSPNPIEHQRELISKAYWLVNSQITYNFRRFSIYLGGENLLNIIQEDAIIAANDPFGNYFDATQIWAPISGVNIYAGIHFAIKQKKK
ncbi:TonB-dependent receptor [Crocinitomix algicola]|uniref:TonB-dependent receptor n=1 Tax=Crocinitomix algicola TaxID=1740263 RepID=UPI0008318CDC|nr:TonB-dependent receptor [Crocinitomix algicola]